jgi:hypothetical protein
VPVLIFPVSEDFDELLEDGGLATVATLRKSGRIVIMTVNVAIMFVVAVFRAKGSRADRASEVVDVIFAI